MIRRATSADSSDLAALHVRTWQQAYADLMPGTFLRDLDLELEARSRQWQQAIAEKTATVLLDCDDDGALVGFAALGRCLDEDAEATWSELGELYYLESHWGSGRAEMLLHQALHQLQIEGSSVATLWVLDGNSRAIAFYDKHGFDLDGQEKVQQMPGFTLRELRMRKPLPA